MKVQVALTEVEHRRAPQQGTIPAAHVLALAHRFQRALDDGEVESQVEIAADEGLTPARVSQLLALLWLAPDIQEEVLFGTHREDMVPPYTARDLRALALYPDWQVQRALWAQVKVGDVSALRELTSGSPRSGTAKRCTRHEMTSREAQKGAA